MPRYGVISPNSGTTALKLWKIACSDEYLRVTIDSIFNPPEWMTAPEFMERQVAVAPLVMEADLLPDGTMLAGSMMRTVKEWFDSPELQSCILRFGVSSVIDV